MEFEWDERKRERNLAKHGVDFRDAIQVFRDHRQLWGYDQEHSGYEDRWWTIGASRNAILFVVTTEREVVLRLISARRATKDEERAYYNNFAR